MNPLLQLLRPKERRGSKPRCHLLTHGSVAEVAARLTALATPFVRISTNDHWMPEGFNNLEEAQLHKADRLLDINVREQLLSWWLVPGSARAMTPNFDIASTCTIQGLPGLLLIEAKAHDMELIKEVSGKGLPRISSDKRRASHEKIGVAIQAARNGLEMATALQWHISRESHYQMSNRFAWAWKLVNLGVPVALLYLGFLHADEMTDRGKSFSSSGEWEQLVLSHSEDLFPGAVWNQTWTVHGLPFLPLIRSMMLQLESGATP